MTSRRYEISDFEWSIIEPLLLNKPHGVPRADDRRLLNGIYLLRRGSPWAHIPERYGSPTTCYNRFVRWRKIGVWNKLFEAVSKAYDGDLQMIESSSIRVHQHAGNVKRGPPETAQGHDTPARCMGRLRGGPTTKIHTLVDANGNPIALKLTEGQAHDGRSACDKLDDIGAGQTLLGDRASIATPFFRLWQSEALGRTSSQCRDVSTFTPSARRSFIATATSSSVSLPRSNILELSQPASKARSQLSRRRQTSRHPYRDALYESLT
jgi:transposase